MLRPASFLLLCALLLPLVAHAQPSTIADGPLSERRVSYTMDVTLAPDARTVRGTQQITWRNPDTVPVEELQFHLYLNAFEGPNTTFMKESGGQHRGFSAESEDRWGGVTVERMVIADPGDAAPLAQPTPTPQHDLTDQIRFIYPDDDNPDDHTAIAVTLPEAVAPGETITLHVDFESRLPEVVARTGWATGDSGRPFFMVAQWFPKLGVYEVPGQRYVPADAPRGQWSTHQFHLNSEFYADFGTYDVTLRVPEDFIVGATGVRVAEETDAEGHRLLRYQADDVHDFAWTASQDYVVVTDQWRHVDLRVLLQPAHSGQAARHLEAAKVALEHFDEWVGEYPYTTLTLVDGLGGSNGMEYPTLITCGTAYMLPEWVRLLEVVTIHEFGHQYFYGLLASNEAEEAWLDEGMNSYLETRIMDAVYGPGAVIDLPFAQVSDAGMQRLTYTKNSPERGPLFNRSWEYQTRSDFGKASYAKPATVMHTLEAYLGWETMQRFLRTYYERWRFRHPTTRDLQDVVEDVAGQDLDWFFEQFVYGTAVIDYAIDVFASEPTEGGEHETTVEVVRNQDGFFPQPLLVRFADGSEQRIDWDGRDARKVFTLRTEAPAVEAYLDPDNGVRLDVNRLDNRRVLASTAPSLARHEQLTITTRIQQFLYLIAALF